MKAILGFAWGRGNPQPWRYLKIPALMINAVDAWMHGFPKLDFEGELWIDSGGYQALMLGLSLNPKKIARWQSRYSPHYAIMPDNPRNPDLTLAWYEEYLRERERPESVVPVVHPTWRQEHFERLKTIIDDFDWLAIGGLVPYFHFPLKRDRVAEAIEFIRRVREEFGCKIHVLGVGGYEFIPVLRSLGVDSFDSTSWIHDARFGIVRVGKRAYSVRVRYRGKNPPLPEDFRCDCPACRLFFEDLRKNGVAGLRARALHNAWNLLKFVEEVSRMPPERALRLCRFRLVRRIVLERVVWRRLTASCAGC